MDFIYEIYRDIQSKKLQVPSIATLVEGFNKVPLNSTTYMKNLKTSDFYSVCTHKQIWLAAKNKSTLHHLYVKEGQACKSVLRNNDDDKLKTFLYFGVKYILSHGGPDLPLMKTINDEWNKSGNTKWILSQKRF